MMKIIAYVTYNLLRQGCINYYEELRGGLPYSDFFDKRRGKLNVSNNLPERVGAVKAAGYADEVIIKNDVGKKIVWADALRGFLILTVVLGHSLQHGDYENNSLWSIIYSFHMAAFFVISGYVGYKEQYKMSSLWGKICRLLMPFAVWTVLRTFINGGGIPGLIKAILLPDTGYWFIFVLFVIISFFVSLVVISQKIHVRTDMMLSGGGNYINFINGFI